MTLQEAINATEQASAALANAQQTTTNDTAKAAEIKAKLDIATNTVTQDTAAQGQAVAAFNQSLDALIAAAQGAKIAPAA